MKKKLYFGLSSIFLVLFVAFTLIISFVDKGVVGDVGSVVGLSTINGWFYERFPLSEAFDFISDLTMIVWLLIVCLFVMFGIVQWFERKKLKLVDKKLRWHTGYIGGLKEIDYGTLMREDSPKALHVAVKGMLPKTTLGRKQITRLHIYKNEEHKHSAQQPEKVEVKGVRN